MEDSLEDPETDPWASPILHSGHDHDIPNSDGPTMNGNANMIGSTVNGVSHKPGEGSRSHISEPHDNGERNQSGGAPPSSSGSGWGDNYNNSGSGFGNSGNSGLGGFGQSGDDQDRQGPNNVSRSIGGGRIRGQGVEEVVTINMLPEKEGMFMLKHRNYEVKCARRASSVIRRYSDFVWLGDCLQKRYPFRPIPLLPPKRIAGTLKAY